MLVVKYSIFAASILFWLLGFVAGYSGVPVLLSLFGGISLILSLMLALLIYTSIVILRGINKFKTKELSIWMVVLNRIPSIVTHYRLYEHYLLLCLFLFYKHYITLAVFSIYVSLKIIVLAYHSLLQDFSPMTAVSYLMDKIKEWVGNLVGKNKKNTKET